MLIALTSLEGQHAQLTIAQQAFATMAEIDVHPSNDSLEDRVLPYSSMLRYSGGCQGTLVLECSAVLAATFAAHMMQIPMPVSLDADMRDALGELINTIGGNLKGLLPAETLISIPEVLQSFHLRAIHAGPAPISVMEMECVYGCFRINLYPYLAPPLR